MQARRVNCRGHPSQILLRPLLVVVPSPLLDDGSRMRQAREPVLVQAFVAQPPVGLTNLG